MPKYRKKPIIVDAIQWFEGDKGVLDRADLSEIWANATAKEGRYYIETAEGNHNIYNGDYIITGVMGEKYPCKPEIFEMTYEKVEGG